MGILIFIIGMILLVAACISGNENNTTTHSNNSNLTLDVNRMYKDSVDVTLGRLSAAERKRREKSGYYMVPKGQEYSPVDELRKKRVAKLIEI